MEKILYQRPEPLNYDGLNNHTAVMHAMREIMWGRPEIVTPLIKETHKLIRASTDNFTEEHPLRIAFLGSGHGGDAAAIMDSFSNKDSPIEPFAVLPVIVDKSNSSLHLARLLNNLVKLPGEYVKGDVNHLPLKTDITIMANLVHHLSDKEAAWVIQQSALQSNIGSIVFEPAHSKIGEFIIPRLAALAKKNPHLLPEAVDEVVRQARVSYQYAHNRRSFHKLTEETVRGTNLEAKAQFKPPWFWTMVVTGNQEVMKNL